MTSRRNVDIVSSSKVILTSIWRPFWIFFNYSMQLRFDFRFVIYAPKLVKLDSFKRDLFIFEPYLLLAKISLKFCKYVRLTVCLFVCLFVRKFFDTGHSFSYIFTKLDPSMYLFHVTKPIVFLGQRSNK